MLKPPALRRLRLASAFTLIELLVVILVLGILIAVAAPSFLGQTEKAHDSAAKQYLTVAYKAAKASTVTEQNQGDYVLATVIQAINSEGSLTATSGTCPSGDPDDLTKIVVDASFTAGGNLKLCNDPERTVWTLTVVGHGPPSFAKVAVDSLTVSKAGPGSGTVTSVPAGIDCGTSCSASFAKNAAVTLTASAASGSAFSGWSGACSGTGSCVVTMSQSRAVTATFDAGSILLVSNRSGNSDVYIANPDGTNAVNLTNNPAEDSFPQFSPDGTKVVFSSNRANATGSDYDLYIVNKDGSGLIQVTNDTCEDYFPTFSPDGTKVVWQDCNNWLKRADAAANGGATAGWVYQNNFDTQPHYSPDGTKLAFLYSAGGPYDVNTLNPATIPFSNRVALTTNSGAPQGVGNGMDWSPDGQYIYYSQLRPDFNYYIYKAKADGSSNVALTAGLTDSNPVVSPDGSKLYFSRQVSGRTRVMQASPVDGSGQAVAFGSGQSYNDFIWDWHN